MDSRRLFAFFAGSVMAGLYVSNSFYFYDYFVYGTLSLTVLIAVTGWKRRESIRELTESVSENLYCEYQAFLSDPRLFLRENLDRKTLKVYGIATGFFSLHFWLQWFYTYRITHMAGGLAILKNFNVFVEQGLRGLLNPGFQINNYTGNPLFLFPIVEILGYSPSAMRIALVSSAAASTAVFFLAYQKLFDLRKAVLGTLLLFSMSEYIYFRWFDYTYVLLLLAVLLYVYALWRESGHDIQSGYLYVIAFFGGLFFYFKTTVLYLLAGFTTAALALKRKDILRADFLGIILLFLAGAAPFFAYNLVNLDHIEVSGDKSNDVSIAGPENLTVTDSLVARYDQMGRWMRSDAYNLNSLSKNDSYFGYNFRPDSPPGGEIRQPLSLRSILTGQDYEIHYFTGFHPLTAALLVLVPLVGFKGGFRDLAALFTTFFCLMIFLPSTSGFRVAHMNVLVPFSIPIYLAALSIIPESLEEKKAFKALYAIVSVVLGLSIVLTAAHLSPIEEAGGSERWTPAHWGGDQVFYSDFKDLDVERDVLTNSYRVNVITHYTPGTHSIYLFPSNMTRGELNSMPRRVAHPIGTGEKYSLDYLNYYHNQTVILRENLPCEPGKEYCGASPENVLDLMDLDAEDTKQVKIDGENYMIARGVDFQRYS